MPERAPGIKRTLGVAVLGLSARASLTVRTLEWVDVQKDQVLCLFLEY